MTSLSTPYNSRTFPCHTDMPSDPFVHMERANKTYGFTIAVKELRETVPNIFRYASAFKRVRNITSQGLWEMFAMPAGASLPEDDPQWQPPKQKTPEDPNALPEEILNTEPGHAGLPDVDPDAMEGETYNMCHFWSNFEIARLDWFRSKEYNDFFDMMDRSGGFWMERVRARQGMILDLHFSFLPVSVCRTDIHAVGRCSNTLPSGRCAAGTPRYTLLSRYRLSPYHHTTLPSERTGQSSTRSTTIS